eukprot:3192667-Karenia_brevis.AAC.1
MFAHPRIHLLVGRWTDYGGETWSVKGRQKPNHRPKGQAVRVPQGAQPPPENLSHHHQQLRLPKAHLPRVVGDPGMATGE